MNEQRNDERLTEVAKQLFDESVESLDAATLSRLNKGRHDALAELSHKRAARQWLWWMPATGVAAAVLVTVMLMRGPNGVDLPPASVTVSDFEILMEDENLEMLEDLEFYSWIDFSELTGSNDVG